PVVDAHDHPAAVLEVGDLNVGGDRQGLVGGGHGVHVVGFAVGGLAPVELGAVPGSAPLLPVAARRGQHVVGAAEHHVGALVARRGDGFEFRDRIGDQTDVDVPGRRAVLDGGAAAGGEQHRQQGGEVGFSSLHVPYAPGSVRSADTRPWHSGSCGCSG